MTKTQLENLAIHELLDSAQIEEEDDLLLFS